MRRDHLLLIRLKSVIPVLARLSCWVFFLVCSSLPGWAGINKKLVVKPDTPDGNFLELISLETDFDKRLTLIEQFTTLFPASDSIGWAYSQLQEDSLKDGQLDRAIKAGDKLLQLDANDLEAARTNLQAAKIKGDEALIKKYSGLMERIAQRLASSPASMDDPDEAAAQKKRLELAANVLVRQEYALYDQAYSATDPRKRINILDELLKLNPHTRYLNDALLIYFLAYRQLNDIGTAVATGERLLQRDSNHEDILLYVADYYFRRKQEPQKVLDYCEKIVTLINEMRKPTRLTEAEWNYQKALYTGTAHYMAGTVHVNQNQFESADRSLRLALPYLKGNNALAPAVLTSLGWANYQLGRYTEAVRFYKQCLPFGGVYGEQATKNLAAIKAEHSVEE